MAVHNTGRTHSFVHAPSVEIGHGAHGLEAIRNVQIVRRPQPAARGSVLTCKVVFTH